MKYVSIATLCILLSIPAVAKINMTMSVASELEDNSRFEGKIVSAEAVLGRLGMDEIIIKVEGGTIIFSGLHKSIGQALFSSVGKTVILRKDENNTLPSFKITE